MDDIKKHSLIKKAAIAAAAGAGIAGANAIVQKDSIKKNYTIVPPNPPQTEDGIYIGKEWTEQEYQAELNNIEDSFQAEIEVVDNYDELSFGEAFAKARALKGPGEVFFWNGELKNTYYVDEYENLSQEEVDRLYLKIKEAYNGNLEQMRQSLTQNLSEVSYNKENNLLNEDIDLNESLNSDFEDDDSLLEEESIELEEFEGFY